MRHRPRHLHQVGETIVEALLATTVISSVLMSAFYVTQQSAESVQDSKERTEVQQLLQGQVERARALAIAQKTTTGGIFTDGQYFCIDTNNSSPTSGQLVVEDQIMNNADLDNLDKYASACLSSQNRYHFAGTYSKATNVFTFFARWDNQRGGQDHEQFAYRVYSGAPVTKTVAALPGNSGPDAQIGTVSGVGDGSNPGGSLACWMVNGWNDPNCWQVYISNFSNNAPGTISKCIWDWGDGTTETFQGTDWQCQNTTIAGQQMFHAYTPTGDVTNAPDYTITLTVYDTNNNVKNSNQWPAGVPY